MERRSTAKTNDGWTPLHEAAAYKDGSSFAQVLLSNGAAVNAKTNDARRRCNWRSLRDASETAAVLRRYGGRR